MKKLFFLALVLIPFASFAQRSVTCNQGTTSTNAEWNQNVSARRGGKTSEVCVTDSAGGTAITDATTALAGRKAIELQNLGPNTIYCTVDGQAPLSTGALGRSIPANGGTWSLNAGPLIVITCIAKTAAQTTTACTQVTELR